MGIMQRVLNFSKIGSIRNSLSQTSTIHKRFFDIHEYQSKQLMDKYGVRVQKWGLVNSADEALGVANKLNAKEYVVKAQVHAGGRGKGVFDTGFKGGVHLTTDPNEAADMTKQMIGNKLITKQTVAGGVLVNKVILCESVDIARETYFSILMDRASNGPVIVASPKGGMDIEQVAE